MTILQLKIDKGCDGDASSRRRSKLKRLFQFSDSSFALPLVLLLTLLTACSERNDTSPSTIASPPLNVAAMGIDSEVLLQWDAVDGAQGYKIYWNSGSDNPTLDSSITVQATSATISNLANEYNYTVRLVSINDAGESQASPNVIVRTRAAKLESIIVTPDQYIITGTSLYYTATGVYSDGSTQDISRWSKWQSSDTSIATVQSDGRAAGLVKAIEQGPFVISASFKDVSGWVSTYSNIIPLQDIIIQPHNPQIAKGTGLSFAAIGFFSYDVASYGYVTQDLTATVTWRSENPRIAKFNDNPGKEGLTYALSLGDTNITASYDGKVAQSTLRVAAATLQSITISPSDPSISFGMTQVFSATGLYSDGSTQEITDSLLWTTSDPSVASVSNYTNANDPAGRASASYWGLPGSTVISARLQNVIASTTLTVAEPRVIALSVEPASISVTPGGLVRLNVFQGYDNGSFYPAAPELFTWTSADNSVASVDANGVVSGIKPGFTTTISVSDPNSPSLSASTVVTVAILPPDHATFTANCVQCHDGMNATGKSVSHVPSDNRCEVCHNVTTWLSIVVDHSAIFNDCVSCHNGVVAGGKSAAHINSTDMCEACHQKFPAVWVPVAPNAVDHNQVIGTCDSCHNGVIASGKSAVHINTSDLCEACHNVSPASWIPVASAAVDHSQVIGSCDSCHDGISARGKLPTHCPTTMACDSCHNTSSFIPAADCPVL